MANPLKGVILDVETKDFIHFFSFEPPQYSRNPVYDDVPIRGRSEPHSFYGYTEAGIWSFAIHFIASIDQNDEGDPASVKEKANFIESLILPDYGFEVGEFSVVLPPHLARIRILKMFDAIGTIRSPSWTLLGPYDVDTGYSYQIDCTFSFNVQKTIGNIDSMSSKRSLLSVGQTRLNR